MTKRGLRLLDCVATQGHDTAMQGHDTAQGHACHMAARPVTRPAAGPRHGRGVPTTQPPRARPWACLCAQAGQGVHSVHLTCFLDSVHCFSHCLNTVHEHYSQKIFKKKK